MSDCEELVGVGGISGYSRIKPLIIKRFKCYLVQLRKIPEGEVVEVASTTFADII